MHLTMKATWIDSYTDSVPLLNDVNQRAVLCIIYIDICLLETLNQSGVISHIGHVYAGAYGYADDFALLAPVLLYVIVIVPFICCGIGSL